MCEWGIMKRAVESQVEGGHRRPRSWRSAPPCGNPQYRTPSALRVGARSMSASPRKMG
jgi:hypothetical protein